MSITCGTAIWYLYAVYCLLLSTEVVSSWCLKVHQPYLAGLPTGCLNLKTSYWGCIPRQDTFTLYTGTHYIVKPEKWLRYENRYPFDIHFDTFLIRNTWKVQEMYMIDVHRGQFTCLNDLCAIEYNLGDASTGLKHGVEACLHILHLMSNLYIFGHCLCRPFMWIADW